MSTAIYLERRDQEDGTIRVGRMEITPAVDEDYWTYRVKLSAKQAVVGFPKFGTVGIGFAQEDDWNTNLPYTCSTQEIFDHIEHNLGDDSISPETVKAAIQLIREAAIEDEHPAKRADREFRVLLEQLRQQGAVINYADHEIPLREFVMRLAGGC